VIYLGIDPGKSGGIAAIDGVSIVETIKLCETPADVCAWIRSCNGTWEWKAVIEQVHSGVFARRGKNGKQSRMGVVSAFTFGKSFGWLLGVLDALRIPYEFVSPQKWQGVMQCRTGGKKNVSKAAAQRLFPQVKVTHAIADALLIAEYARRLEARK
jgi:crossover junction endodeoxyribonuclease RuvC